MSIKTKFKSSATEKRWVDLQKEKTKLQEQKITPAIQKKLETINSLMTACKVGFDLSEAKIKKIAKVLKEKTGMSKSKYGALPTDVPHHAYLFKDVVVAYAEKDDQVFFRENATSK